MTRGSPGDAWTLRSLFAPLRLAAASWAMAFDESAILKMAPALHLLCETGGIETKIERTDEQPEGEHGNAHSAAAF
jgi:hypothetical protein